MPLTDREQRVLNGLEAELARVSSRPRREHLLAGCAAHRWQAITATVIVAALVSLAVLTTPVTATFLAAAAAVVATQAACVIWHDAVNRAAGD